MLGCVVGRMFKPHSLGQLSHVDYTGMCEAMCQAVWETRAGHLDRVDHMGVCAQILEFLPRFVLVVRFERKSSVGSV